jgi:hypothetical protein
VHYLLILGENATCIEKSPKATEYIECPYIDSKSRVGVMASTFTGLGIAFTSLILMFTIFHRADKVLKRSQLIFIYTFLTGAILMNATVRIFTAPFNDSTCLARPWCLNISSSIMLAPLIMKLHRVETIYRALQRGERRKRISHWHVEIQLLFVLLVDVVILIAWTIADRPRGVYVTMTYPDVHVDVQVMKCSSHLSTTSFEKVMVAWKGLLLLFGVLKSIRTWDIPSDLAEAKYFAIAIYNITVVGGFTYFLSVHADANIVTVAVMQCIGIFLSATLSVIIIMMPKLILVEVERIFKLDWGGEVYDETNSIEAVDPNKVHSHFFHHSPNTAAAVSPHVIQSPFPVRD